MYIVLGATGHVGSSVAENLLRSGVPITVVTRDEAKAAVWRSRSAQAAIVDVADAGALRSVFQQGRRAFLLNPPADPSTDTDQQEHRTLASIISALDGSGLEKVVLQSTYGAQAGERLGDLSVLFDFEQALSRQPIPFTVLRAAYYMSNWDSMLEPARQGVLPSLLPADLAIPMVAPADLGAAAARLTQEAPEQAGIRYVEGPQRYSSTDVAAAFAQALGRGVELSVTPREDWETTYRKLGFSQEAASAYTRMTAVSVDSGFDMPAAPERGPTSLNQYIGRLVRDGRYDGGDRRDTRGATSSG